MALRKKKCIVGFDFGTTSLSVVVLSLFNSSIEHVLNYNTNAYIDFEDNLRKEQSLDKIKNLFEKAMSEINLMQDIEIVGYSFTGQMHGIIGLDSNGEAVTNLVTWQDKSGDIKVADNLTILDEIRNLTGVDTLSNGYGIVTLYKWIHHDRRTDIASFCTVPDYFAQTLVPKNSKVTITPTMAHSIGLFDAFADQWQTNLITKIGLSKINFPEIVEESYILGNDSQNDIPVFSAIGDNQASFRGSVVDKKHTALLNVGTGSQISVLVKKSEIENYLKYVDGFETQIRPYDSTHFLLATSFMNGGAVYKSLFNFFKDVAISLFGIKDIDDSQIWAKMMELGDNIGEKGASLDVVPLLEGQRKNPTLGATISNLHSTNFTSGDFVAGFLSGLARYYKTGLYPELEESLSIICGSGNGLKKNRLFCDLIENTFGHPLKLTPYDEEAALGAILNSCSKVEDVREGDILESLNKIV